MRHTPGSDFLREWLEETEGGPPDPVDGTAKAASRLDDIKQASRWWPFPTFYRSARTAAHPPTTTDTSEYRPRNLPAANGRSPTVSGRTTSMLSPVKAMTAGALVLAIGGVMLVAQPFQQHGTAPGAEAQAPPPVEFATTFSMSGQASPGVTEMLANGVVRHSAIAWRGASSAASDPRFEGLYVWTITFDTYPDGVEFNTGAARITNDEGAWQQVPVQFFNWTDGRDTPSDIPMALGETAQRVFVGEGGYEGLVAVAVETNEDASGSIWSLEGFILDGDLPPVPEPYADEVES